MPVYLAYTTFPPFAYRERPSKMSINGSTEVQNNMWIKIALHSKS
jgi:hypothetical protein